MPSVVRPCECSHEYQDEKYGPGNRLHTVGAKNKVFRCTRCGREKLMTDAEAKKYANK